VNEVGHLKVQLQQHKAEIRQPDSADMLDLLQNISGTSPVDVMAARMMVEPHAASAAASNASISDLARIREAHEDALRETDPASFEKLDAEFHVQIFAATRSELLVSLHDILRLVRNQPAWIEMKRRRYTEERRQGYCRDHDAIVQALLSRNAGLASEAMKIHLHHVHRNLFGD
jgi:DNA-binding FadR family transcriptional regulator